MECETRSLCIFFNLATFQRDLRWFMYIKLKSHNWKCGSSMYDRGCVYYRPAKFFWSQNLKHV